MNSAIDVPAGNPRPSEAAAKLEDSGVVAAVRDYLNALETGCRPDRAAFLARYPALSGALAEVLDGLEFMHDAASRVLSVSELPDSAAQPALGMPLGDFRLLREIGRGGMGVVYESEQISLGRRVALKVLPFASTLDAKQLQRFKNEAQAAAHLHHTNIVPVHATGCERGVHYYAMQFIEGQTLASVIADLRAQSEQERRATEHAPEALSGPANAVLTALWIPKDGVSPAKPDSWTSAPGGDVPPLSGAESATTTKAGITTQHSTRSPAYFRTVAKLGVQAAEALEHAHEMGVVHRDIKPANLLVDGRGHLWVTDFGLAHCQSQAGLTMSGDLVGTLRYMSPEQALAKRVIVDHRTDIYSLGVSLYELLTLEPAFNGRDRQELLRQIAFEEPKSPRRLNPAIPAELETITLKALEKNPTERYSAAQDLADDLARFLKDEPIQAKPPSLAQRARRWSRRHLTLVWSVAVGLLMAIVVLSGSFGWILRDRDARLAQAVAALEEATRLEQQAKWVEAEAAVGRAEALLKTCDGTKNQWKTVQELRADLAMARKLEDARLEGASAAEKFSFFGMEGSWKQSAARLGEAFRDYGIDVEVLDATYAAERINARPIRVELAAALDHWAEARWWDKKTEGKDWKDLLALARAADPDPWRELVRQAWQRGDRQALEEIARADQLPSQPAATVTLLASALEATGFGELNVTVLRNAQRLQPGAFWINHALASQLAAMRPPRSREAVWFYSVAVALRPQSPGAHMNLGVAYANSGFQDEALAQYRAAADVLGEAIRLRPNWAEGHVYRGQALSLARDMDQAIPEFREAVSLRPDWDRARSHLARALLGKGLGKEAIATWRELLELNPEHHEARCQLGDTFAAAGLLDEAMEEWREIIRRKPAWPNPAYAHPAYVDAHHRLGRAWEKKGFPDRAIAAHKEAVRLSPNSEYYRIELAYVLSANHRYHEAIAEYDAAIHLQQSGWSSNNLAWLLATCPDLKLRDSRRALELAKKVTEWEPRNVRFWNTLGVASYRADDWKAAIEALNTAEELSPGEFLAWNAFFLAMAHWQLGEKEQARRDYDRAVQWMEKEHPKDEELRRFRAEAEEVLGISHR
jgi:serine/threonine protein kinase/Flp pilus assembly protein TadD